MKIENTEVYGFKASLRGMRNPLDSWDKSDSSSDVIIDIFDKNYNVEDFRLGEIDKNLAQKLTKAGSEHCKFLRQIQVWVDLTLPRFIWSEFDTYKFNTKNSCSTMHTIHRRNLTQEDFEYEIHEPTLRRLNHLITLRKSGYLCSSEFIHTIKNELPDGFLQKRTVNTNYAELLNMIFQRGDHRLSQWKIDISQWIIDLPYFLELTGFKK